MLALEVREARYLTTVVSRIGRPFAVQPVNAIVKPVVQP